jgi:hypothetical protein
MATMAIRRSFSGKGASCCECLSFFKILILQRCAPSCSLAARVTGCHL